MNSLFDTTEVTFTDFSGKERRVPFRIAGSGPPILFLHGFPLDSRMWEPLMARLQNKFRCIAPDLRGFGEASEENRSYQLDDVAQDLYHLIQAKGIQQKVTLCALSMGGYVAMRFVHQYPELVSRVILSNSRGNGDDAAGRKTRLDTAVRAIAGDPYDAVSPMYEKLLSERTRKGEPEICNLVQDMLRRARASSISWAQLAMAARPDSLVEMKEWSVPTLCVVGEQDPITPPEAARAMFEAVPQGALRIDPNSAHMTPLESPDWFAEQIANWPAVDGK